MRSSVALDASCTFVSRREAYGRTIAATPPGPAAPCGQQIPTLLSPASPSALACVQCICNSPCCGIISSACLRSNDPSFCRVVPREVRIEHIRCRAVASGGTRGVDVRFVAKYSDCAITVIQTALATAGQPVTQASATIDQTFSRVPPRSRRRSFPSPGHDGPLRSFHLYRDPRQFAC